jgi:hypothetical protein
MNSIRIPLSTSRKAAIQATYDRLSSGASLSASTLLEMYDTSIDSRVRDGKLSKEEAIKEYKQLWPNAVSISCADFVEVYSDVSPVVEVDAHFNQLLQESWR